ncbi:hypothetical protein [Acinetobacter sp. YH16057]|uniref:hypothetical protein n=1 Tax=Acinetobacter sp. YH16057 TaxID=2601195 RepID=UPI0015D15B68|nr:hypothetical protein [Acinetobacter sp. YH16057]
MEKGYYLFAYVEINKYANFYKTDTKRHDQNISLWEYDGGKLSLLRYWELERLSRIKHHNKAFYSETQFKNIVNVLLSEFNLQLSDIKEYRKNKRRFSPSPATVEYRKNKRRFSPSPATVDRE